MQLRKLRQLCERLFKIANHASHAVCEGLVWSASAVLRCRGRHTERPRSQGATKWVQNKICLAPVTFVGFWNGSMTPCSDCPCVTVGAEMQWQILLSRSYPHRHAGFRDAAGHDDYCPVLQDISEMIVVEEGAMLDEGSKAPAEGTHGRTQGWLMKRRHARS